MKLDKFDLSIAKLNSENFFSWKLVKLRKGVSVGIFLLWKGTVNKGLFILYRCLFGSHLSSPAYHCCNTSFFSLIRDVVFKGQFPFNAPKEKSIKESSTTSDAPKGTSRYQFSTFYPTPHLLVCFYSIKLISNTVIQFEKL